MWFLTFIFLLHLSAVLAAKNDNETFALKFLNQYHYISQSWTGNQDVDTAIKNFQHYSHLKETGKLDDATVGLMKKSRCGMPDVDEQGKSRRRRRFVTISNWDKTAMTYYIQYGNDLNNEAQDNIFSKAFQFWADVSKLTFNQVDSPEKADIKISFGKNIHASTTGEHVCAHPFDGEGGVLAHAYFPSDGRAHFDEAEHYTDNSDSGVNLLLVATHELGHALGLEHTDIDGAVMYPYYTGYNTKLQLHSDDIAGIQSLYGSIFYGFTAG